MGVMTKTRQITVGEREFTLHACPAIGLAAIGGTFAEIGTGSNAGLEALTDGIYYGVKRGAQADATITRDFFAWNIDATNVGALIEAFAEVNGAVLKEPAPGEA